MNDPILRDSVFNGHSGEAVDLDADYPAITSNIDAQRAVFEQCWEVNLRELVSLTITKNHEPLT